MIFDTHAHYDDEAFDQDRDVLLSSLPDKGVCGVVNAACNLDSAEKCLQLADAYPLLWAAVGIHPIDALSAGEGYLEKLREMASTNQKVVAIGEIGLDYYYDVPKEIQNKMFREQLHLANELRLPVIVHDRDAHGPILDILKEYHPQGVIHRFSGSVEMAKEALKLGLYIGIGGALTFKNSLTLAKVASYVPMDRILLETDCPYMAPVPFRGKRCDSSLICYVAEKLAEIKGIPVEEVYRAAKSNAETLFAISQNNGT